MKKNQLLNAPISHLIANMGHTDSLIVCDAGLPIPQTIERIDLAISPNIPDLLTVISAICSELFVEKVILAEEIKQFNPTVHQQILDFLTALEQQQQNRIEKVYISHTEFKQQCQQAKGAVRSGAYSPYANIILHSGVPF